MLPKTTIKEALGWFPLLLKINICCITHQGYNINSKSIKIVYISFAEAVFGVAMGFFSTRTEKN